MNELLNQLKKHFENTPREELEKEWEELSEYNNIGPTVEEYLESVSHVSPEHKRIYDEYNRKTQKCSKRN